MTGPRKPPPLAVCTCGHLVVVHHLTPGGRRTYCTHADATGRCRCDEAALRPAD
jgi:hypothetical protein